jgi:signal peptidase I
MASVAEYAPTQASERRGPVPWVAALLTVLTPGLGHLYIGLALRGVILFFLVMAADTLLMQAMMGVLARFWMFAVSVALLFGLWLFILIDATVRAYRMQEFEPRPYNKWQVYLGAFVAACLIFAVPCVYALHAKASGQLGYFRATVASMTPTLHTGEYFLADSTFYRSRAPSRGEVAVYVHPRQADVHCIKRIVAIEGDRIAVKSGRIVVNGMPAVEPYAEASGPDASLTTIPETIVPAGHVFVIGDNRDKRLQSFDRCDPAVHGTVPVNKLIGRVTDIAFSNNLARIGRWIGTPSKL